MKRSILLMFLWALAGWADAQQAKTDQPPLYHGPSTNIDGVYITPVAGAPFSATAEIQTEVTLPDGSVETRHTINMIARDSVGRIHNERRQLVSESFHGTPRILSVHIFDPQTRMSTFYNPTTQVAQERLLPASPLETRPSEPGTKPEDLGTSNLNGVEAKGLRYTRTISAAKSGTGKDVVVTDEYWYSDELHINLMVRHTDPRSGTQTVALTSINRQEPDAAMFQVPTGFKTVDVTPPARER